MKAGLPWQAFDHRGEVDDLKIVFVAVDEVFELFVLAVALGKRSLASYRLGDHVDLPGFVVIDAADVAKGLLRAHRLHRDDVGGVLFAITGLDVIDDLFPGDVCEIDVDIRHRLAFGVEKTFKEKVVFDGVGGDDV